MTLNDDELALIHAAIENGDGCLQDEECCHQSIHDLEPAIEKIAYGRAAPFIRQVEEYNSAITWDTTCLNCSHLMSRLYDTDMALEVALIRIGVLEGKCDCGSQNPDRVHHGDCAVLRREPT